ncbi:MAG: hypothetical protein LBT14_14075 [Treponema sp.]|jgi:hypothetical protein|nr:hypothetical protein [Treponema sp.]
MRLFCLLWMPLFYLFWLSLSSGRTGAGSGGIWALLLGSIVALVQFFLGSFIEPGGFGVSRWISAGIDIVGLPAVLPLVVCLLLMPFGAAASAADFTNFALLWLIPGAAIRTIDWIAHKDPLLLVLVPLLWTAVAVGIPFFIQLMAQSIAQRKPLLIIPTLSGILALPCMATTTYWTFFAHKSFQGFVLFTITMLPLLTAIGYGYYQGGVRKGE